MTVFRCGFCLFDFEKILCYIIFVVNLMLICGEIMNKCLILLTSCFPYDTKETFIENEINFHSKHFEKIIILAQELSPSVTDARPIPDNADAFNIAKKDKKIARYGDVLKGGLRFLTPSDACKSDKARIGKSISKKVFCEYFEQRSQRQFKESLDILKKYDFTQFDEVVIYSYWFFANCRTAILLKEYLKSFGINAKVYSRAHGYDLYDYVNKLNYLPLRAYMAKDVEKIFTCSENGSNYLKEIIPEYADKIECSYLGTVDNGLSYYDKTFHFVTCSRTVEVKRLDRLIEAISALKDNVGEIYWTHIGDGPMQEKIKSLCNEKLGFMNVEFLGNLNYSQVNEYYRTHPVNLFVNASRSEGLPVSIMEAISFGIPVLATDVGGTGEIIKDGVNGYLLNKNYTDEEFVGKFKIFYNADDEKIKSLRNNARKIWEANFSAENNYPRFCSMIANTEIEKVL